MPKRKTSYTHEWTKEFGFVSRSRKDDFHVFCTYCHCDVEIGSKGKSAIERHAASNKHKLNARSIGTSSLTKFLPAARSPADDKILAAELCKVYHAVKHHQSYRSVDCGVKMDKEIYGDSTIAKGVTCGKTKAKALCENVLAPYSVQKHLNYIKENNLYYSVASDASNKGAIKCFPIVLRYFDFEDGIQHVLLDFYSDNDETAEAITSQLLSKLEMSGLDVTKMSAYSADNASVNYGKHKSVYQKLKVTQKSVIAANCIAHILHNSTRFASGQLNIDVENIVLKVYSHFSTSASRTAQLQEFCEFVEIDNCNLLRHVVTRWLSLLPAIERILKFWKAFRSYFQTLGEDECPKFLWKCFKDESEARELSEIYFLFLSHALKLFTDTIEALEAKSFSITEVYKLMTELKKKLERRVNDGYYSFAVNSKLSKLIPELSKKCKRDFTTFYERAIKYLSDRYDFTENSFHNKVSKLSLTSSITFEEFSDAVQACNIEDIDMDALYEEYGIVETVFNSSEMAESKSEDRYLKLFSKSEIPLTNLKKVSAYIFSIPCSNAHTERIFSMMASAWTKDRNRLQVDSVKAELQICNNFSEECSVMYKEFLSNRRLLETASKGQKYKK